MGRPGLLFVGCGGVGFVVQVGIVAVEVVLVFVLVVFAEDVVDVRFFVVFIIEGDELCFPVQGLLGDEA